MNPNKGHLPFRIGRLLAKRLVALSALKVTIYYSLHRLLFETLKKNTYKDCTGFCAIAKRLPTTNFVAAQKRIAPFSFTCFGTNTPCSIALNSYFRSIDFRSPNLLIAHGALVFSERFDIIGNRRYLPNKVNQGWTLSYIDTTGTLPTYL